MQLTLNRLAKPAATPIHRTLSAAAAAAAKRDAKKTKRVATFYEPPPPCTREEEIFRHSAWSTKRERVKIALQQVGTSPNQMSNFCNCGNGCVVLADYKTGDYRVSATYCHSRHCEPCARARANLMAANLRQKLATRKELEYRFITLTLKHSDAPLAAQIKRLYACFRALRKTPAWKESQNGGCVIFEAKWNPDTGEWHPHLHVISQGGFLRREHLQSAWLNVTGDSNVVDIKLLKRDKDAAYYVSKYVGKGTNNEVWYDADASQEWILATKGLRIAATYGTWRGFRLLAKPPVDQRWVAVDTLTRIIAQAQAGDQHAQGILAYLNEHVKYDPHRKRKALTCPDAPT